MIWRITAEAGLSKGDTLFYCGSISRLEWLTTPQLDTLQEAGYIQPVSAPPLHAMPEFRSKAEALAGAGITTVVELIEVDAAELAKRIKSTTAKVEVLQRRALAMLSVPPPDSG